MISDELLSKFDRIEDLPVSEEMLGAYIEGNLSGSEIDNMELMLQNMPGVNNLYNEVAQTLDFADLQNDRFDCLNAYGIFSSSFSTEDAGHLNDIDISDTHLNMFLPNIDDSQDVAFNNWAIEDNNIGFDLNSDDKFDLNF